MHNVWAIYVAYVMTYDCQKMRAICDSIDDTYVSWGESTICGLIRRYACGYAIIVQAFCYLDSRTPERSPIRYQHCFFRISSLSAAQTTKVLSAI